MSRWLRWLNVVLIFSLIASIPATALAQTSPADKQQIQKVLTQIKQALTQADGVFRKNQYGDAIKAYQAVYDQVQPFKTDPLFSGDKEKVEISTDEYLSLVGLGRANFGNIVGPTAIENSLLLENAEHPQLSAEQAIPVRQYLQQALDIAKALPENVPNKGWAYLVLGFAYQRWSVGGAIYGKADVEDLLKAQVIYGSAAEAFGHSGDRKMQAISLYERGETMTALLGEKNIGDLKPTDIYEILLDSWEQANRLYFLPIIAYTDRICLYTIQFAEQVYNKIIEDPNLDLDALLSKTARFPACRGIDFDRGYLTAVMAWRGRNPDLAQQAIPDIISGIQGYLDLYKNNPRDLYLFSAHLLYAHHRLGQAYTLVGGRSDQALAELEEAETVANGKYGKYQDLSTSVIIAWFDTQSQYENTWLIGKNLVILGRYKEAVDRLTSLDKVKDFNSNKIYPDVMLDLSDAYVGLGEYDTAVTPLTNRREYYEKVLNATKDPDEIKQAKVGIIDTILRLSTPLAVLGRTEEALTGLQQAVDQATSLNDPALLVDTVLRVGDIYLQLDSEDNALNSYNQAADLADKAKMPEQQGLALLGAGQIQLRRGVLDKALASLTRAQKAMQAANDIDGQVHVLTALGDLALKGDKPDAKKAKASYTQALGLANRSGDRSLGIDVLRALGDLQAQTDPQGALLIFHRALVLAQAIDNRENIARLYARIGQIRRDAGQSELAGYAFADAVDVVEQTQRGFHSENLTSQFAANYAGIYADYIKILFTGQNYNLAFDISERARARAFLDQLAIGPVDLRQGASADLYAKETALRQNIEAIQRLLTEAESATPPDQEHIASLRKTLQTAQADYTQLFTRMQAEDPALTSLSGVETASVASIQKTLDSKTTLLSFYTTDAQSYAFVITADHFTAIPLDVKQSQLRDAVIRFRADEKQAAGLDDLSKWLIAPLIDKLTTPKLLIVPHSVLHYLPFAALPVTGSAGAPSKVLGDQFAISYLPSATTLLHLPKEPQHPGGLLALGNPTADGQAPLPFAEQEVKQVAALTQTQPYIGADAKESLIWQNAPKAGVLYLAAHGTFNARNPLFSAVHLTPGDGESGSLEAYKVYRLDLTQNTELVVLSACDTGVGVLSAGDEFFGLNRAFLYAGTPNVIASLWSIDDKATAQLMEAFFKARQQGLSAAEALQQAQATLRNFQDSSGQHPYSSPYYWAAFILTGRGK